MSYVGVQGQKIEGGRGGLKMERKQGEKLLAGWGCVAGLSQDLGMSLHGVKTPGPPLHLSSPFAGSHPPSSPTPREGRQNGLRKKRFALVYLPSNS